ncbi:MAG TPA: DegV family protein [Anaerolineales bacterium]|nr:DegV family protein [Anaerolineales bacterium]
MPSVCILTDSTAQFTKPNFPGRERVYTIPFSLQPGSPVEDGKAQHARPAFQQLLAPSPQDFTQYYSSLGQQYDSILVLTISSLLNVSMKNAVTACNQFSNHAAVEVVDSLTTAIGLGLLVQEAAEAASRGEPLAEIERQIRVSIPHIYMLFCIPELTFLANAGYMEFAQAQVGEMMGMLPIFAIEEGRLVPMEKVRTPRHLFESFQDFMSEFEAPAYIALMRGVSHTTLRTRPLRLFAQETFPGTPFSEHSIHPHLAAMFGPQSIGLVVFETLD